MTDQSLHTLEHRYFANLPSPGPVEARVPAGFTAVVIRHDDLGEIEIDFTEPATPGRSDRQSWATLLETLPTLHLELLAQRQQLRTELQAAHREVLQLRNQIAALTHFG